MGTFSMGSQWQQEYDALLHDAQARGDLQPFAGGSERRVQPRFRLRSQHVFIKVEPRFDVADVSVSGMGLLSDFPFRIGQTLNITLGKAFSVEAVVMDCRLVLFNEDLLETKYQVRCQFADESVGMQFLVMMKQMDDLEINTTFAATTESA